MPVDGGTAAASVTNTRVLDKAPQAPVIKVLVSGANALVDWEPVTLDVDGGAITVTKYQLWRSTNPYFTPGGTPSAEVAAPATSYTDPGVVADPDSNWYYIVRAVSAASLSSANSNRAGEFGLPAREGFLR